MSRTSPRLISGSGSPLQNPEGSDEGTLECILKEGYPAGAARVVAALTRRCRELQSALIEATDQLDKAHLAVEGLRKNDGVVLELSQVLNDMWMLCGFCVF